MNGSMTREIEAWENEGGASPDPLLSACWESVSGSAVQVEWEGRIKCHANVEFDGVAAPFRSSAGTQAEDRRAGTETIAAILQAKRAEVLSRKQTGYIIHDWQEINDQVRQTIFHDARYHLPTEAMVRTVGEEVDSDVLEGRTPI